MTTVTVVQNGRTVEVPSHVWKTIKPWASEGFVSAPQSIRNLAGSAGLNTGGGVRKALARRGPETSVRQTSLEPEPIATAVEGGVIVQEPIATGVSGGIVYQTRVVRPATRVTPAPVSLAMTPVPMEQRYKIEQGTVTGLGQRIRLKQPTQAERLVGRPLIQLGYFTTPEMGARMRARERERVYKRSVTSGVFYDIEAGASGFATGLESAFKERGFTDTGGVRSTIEFGGGVAKAGAGFVLIGEQAVKGAPKLAKDPIQIFALPLDIGAGAFKSIIPTGRKPMEVGYSLGALGLFTVGAKGKAPRLTPKSKVYSVTAGKIYPGPKVAEVSAQTFAVAERPTIFSKQLGLPFKKQTAVSLSSEFIVGRKSVSVARISEGGATTIRGRPGTGIIFDKTPLGRVDTLSQTLRKKGPISDIAGVSEFKPVKGDPFLLEARALVKDTTIAGKRRLQYVSTTKIPGEAGYGIGSYIYGKPTAPPTQFIRGGLETVVKPSKPIAPPTLGLEAQARSFVKGTVEGAKGPPIIAPVKPPATPVKKAKQVSMQLPIMLSGIVSKKIAPRQRQDSIAPTVLLKKISIAGKAIGVKPRLLKVVRSEKGLRQIGGQVLGLKAPTKQRQRMALDSLLRLKTRTTTKRGFPAFGPPVGMPMGGAPRIPLLMPGVGEAKRPPIFGKPAPRRGRAMPTPSLVGIVFDIRGKPQSFSTGIGVRPIPIRSRSMPKKRKKTKKKKKRRR